MMLKNIVYPRKSSESEDRQILSIPAQIAELRALAERRGERIDIVLEESRSAREPGRPVFGKLLKMVERGEIGTIYAWRLDRLARNPVDGAYLIHHLGHGRIKQIATPEGVFTGSGNDKLLMQIHFGMATKFVDDLSENVKRGIREVLKTGNVPGPIPLGYLKARDQAVRGDRGTRPTIVDPVRFPLVRELWRKFLTGGYSIRELLDESRRIGLTVPARRGRVEQPMSLSTLCQILRNPFYTGEVVRGGNRYQGIHEPMIGAAEFLRAQEMVARRDQRRPQKNVFLYAGFVKCGRCGRTAFGERHPNRVGRIYVYYRCGRKGDGTSKCAEPYVAATRIDDEVRAVLGRLCLPEPLLRTLEEQAAQWLRLTKEGETSQIEALSQKLARVQKTLEKLTDLLIAGLLEEMEYKRRKEVALQESRSLEATLADARRGRLEAAESVKAMLEVTRHTARIYMDSDIQTQRQVLGQLGARISLKDHGAVIDLAEPFRTLATTTDLEQVAKACEIPDSARHPPPAASDHGGDGSAQEGLEHV